MKSLFTAFFSLSLGLACAADKTKEAAVTGPLQFKMNDIDGKEVDLSTYKGKVVVFVNVASKCGYTSQYKGLEALYEKHKDAGLVIIGVPANEFGGQEPGTNDEIKKFCTTKFSVTFPMMAKVAVKGKDICPLYKHLTDKAANPTHGGDVKWNFEKFLINRKGEVAGRFDSGTDPESDELTKAVKAALDAK